MATAKEYRKYAKGCLELYNMAETAEQRQTFLDMARDLNLAAAHLEGVLSPEQVRSGATSSEGPES